MQLQMNPGLVHKRQLHLNTVFHAFFCFQQHIHQCLLFTLSQASVSRTTRHTITSSCSLVTMDTPQETEAVRARFPHLGWQDVNGTTVFQYNKALAIICEMDD